MKHAPLPFVIDRDPRPSMEWNIEIDTADGHTVAFLTHNGEFDVDGRCPLTEANAVFITTACNSHDKLVEALRSCYEYFDNRYDGAPDSHCQDMVEPMEKARIALAQLKEKP